jgi:hypothetical protein
MLVKVKTVLPVDINASPVQENGSVKTGLETTERRRKPMTQDQQKLIHRADLHHCYFGLAMGSCVEKMGKKIRRHDVIERETDLGYSTLNGWQSPDLELELRSYFC